MSGEHSDIATTLSPKAKSDLVKRAEWTAAILLSVVVVFLCIVRATHAGALWRDECESLQLARMPMATNLEYNSFPLLFPAVIRGYTALFGSGDVGLRLFGLAVGIALVAMAWIHSRIVREEVPLVFLVLIGLNTTFLTVGTSIRGYGLGSVLIVLAFGLTAKLLLKPTIRRLAAVFLSYFAGIQYLFFDAALLPAISLAVIAVWLVRGRFKWVLALLPVAVVCAASYIPYLKKTPLDVRTGVALVKSPVSLAAFWEQWKVACGVPASLMSILWLGIFFIAVSGAIWRLAIIWRRKPSPEFDLLIFGLLTILISIPGYFGFLRVLNSAPQPRYYVALLCLLAAAIDLIVANLALIEWIRWARVGFVSAAVVILPIAAWSKIIERQTNIDIVAEKLRQDASANDLIVVNPWYVGLSFDRYYHGPVRWMTVPEMSERRIHRYDLVKAKMQESEPLADIKAAMQLTLESGNRVWIVGGAAPPVKDLPLELHPAPDPTYGWDESSYRNVWSMQLGAFLQTHVINGGIVLGPASGVNADENVPLLNGKGWRD